MQCFHHRMKCRIATIDTNNYTILCFTKYNNFIKYNIFEILAILEIYVFQNEYFNFYRWPKSLE